MARPFKGGSRAMMRTFSYPGELDPFFKRLQKRLEKDGTTLSAFLVEAAAIKAKRLGVDLERSRSGAAPVHTK